MDNAEFTKIVMNPVRQRIIQFLILNGKGTPKEMRVSLSDIPMASLYRHIKILFDAGCIEVVEEKKVRGTIEKTYSLVKQPMTSEPTAAEVSSLIQGSLMSIQASFAKYFLSLEEAANESGDSKKLQDKFVEDMLLLQTSTLLLTDEEFTDFLQKFGNLLSGIVQNEPAKGRKMRRFTIISSPQESD